MRQGAIVFKTWGRAVLAAALTLTLVARGELVDRVAAVINNDIIALSEVEQRAAPELARVATERDPKKRGELRQQALKTALDQLIGEKLLETQLKDLNLDVTEQEIDAGIEDVKKQNQLDQAGLEQEIRNSGFTMTSYRAFLKKNLAKLKLINLKVRSKVKVSDDDLRVEYTRWLQTEQQDPEVHARHIVVLVSPKASNEDVEKARKKAEELAKEARHPGVDFAELAKKKSEGPSAPDGGDLGYFRRGVMLPQFDRAVFSLKVGEVSEPVRTNFGWHVIKVEDRRAPEAKPFEEMKDQLRERLFRSQMEKYTEQYVQELRQQAAVEVKI